MFQLLRLGFLSSCSFVHFVDKSEMANIRDVAEAAGVSVQTVSNVIHGRPFMRPETMQRVQQAMAELRYQPSRVAQGMRRQSSQALGFLLSDPNPRGLADPFYGEVLAGLSSVTRQHNYSLVITYLPASPQPQDFLAPFETHQVDAAVVFIAGVAEQQAAALRALARGGHAIAVLEREVKGANAYSVLAANFEGAQSATQALIDAGHQRIAFLDSVQRWPSIDLRREGYAAAMRDAGLGRYIAFLSGPDWTAEGGGAVVERALSQRAAKSHPTAIVAASDVIAVGALQAIKARGLRVPVDIALIGFDDFEFTRYVDPPLTTVRLPAFDMGRRAAELLLAHLRGKPAPERRVVLPTQLIRRRSS
jgi:DNA-binding LacI/PurR family transcriptional regulator